MKDRLISCIHYLNEGCCDLGKEGTFYKHCQTCKSYRAVPGGKPAKPNDKRGKLNKINKKETDKMINRGDY